jgi:hypothetical protein
MVSLIALAQHSSRVEASLAIASRQSTRPRSISRSAGHALETLGHAIEYLTDQYVDQSSADDFATGQLEAIQILMAVNRSIYFDCPEKVGLLDRLGAACRSLISRNRPPARKAA